MSGWSCAPGRVDRRRHDTAFAITRSERCLWRGEQAARLGEPVRAGESFYVGASDATVDRIRRLATELGVTFKAVTSVPDTATAVRPRIGLWDQCGGSIDSGWTRWILEQFDFPFSASTLAARCTATCAPRSTSDLSRRAIPHRRRRRPRGGERPSRRAAECTRSGRRVTGDRTVPQIRSFVQEGGTVVAIGTRRRTLPRSSTPHRESPGRERRSAAAREVLRAGSALRARRRPSRSRGACGRERTSSSTTARYFGWPRARPPQAACEHRHVRRTDAAPEAAGRGVEMLDGGSSRSRRGSVGAGSCSTAPRSCSAPTAPLKFLFNAIY